MNNFSPSTALLVAGLYQMMGNPWENLRSHKGSVFVFFRGFLVLFKTLCKRISLKTSTLPSIQDEKTTPPLKDWLMSNEGQVLPYNASISLHICKALAARLGNLLF